MDNNKRLSEEELQKVFAKLQRGNDNVQYVELDDEFEFNCNRCGGCCTNRNDILVTPYDVYNLAVHFGVTGREIINEYFDVYIGNSSHLPVATIKDTPEHKCPFLEFDAKEMLYKCAVNDRKPGPCKTHPFGVVRSMNAETLELDIISFIKTSFCNNHGGTKITVREYLGEEYLNSLEERKASYKLQSFVTKLLNLEKIHAIINKDESYDSFNDKEKELLKVISESNHDLLCKSYMVSYLEAVYNFNPNESFLSQCEKSFKELIKSSAEFTALLFAIGFDVKPENKDIYNKIIKQHMTLNDFNNHLKEIAERMKKINERFDKEFNEGAEPEC